MITIVNETGNGEEIVIPKTNVETGSNQTTGTTTDSGTGTDVNCRDNQVPSKAGVPSNTANKNIAQIINLIIIT